MRKDWIKVTFTNTDLFNIVHEPKTYASLCHQNSDSLYAHARLQEGLQKNKEKILKSIGEGKFLRADKFVKDTGAKVFLTWEQSQLKIQFGIANLKALFFYNINFSQWP